MSLANAEALGSVRAEVLHLANRIGAHESLELLRLFAERCEAGERFPGLITIADIQKAVARHYGVTVTDLVSARQGRDVCRPRHVAMYLAKRLTRRSLPEIGRRFGGRDHTTVMHAVDAVGKRRNEHPQTDADVRALEAELSA